MREELRVRGLNEPVSHYADAVRWGDLLFISGLAPLDEAGRLVGGDDAMPRPRPGRSSGTRRRSSRPRARASRTCCGWTVYLTDIADRQEFFDATRPASTLVEVSALVVPGMKVEIEAIAGLKRPR